MQKRKNAMTLVGLLVVLTVTSVLLCMYIPVLTQGLINITTGKSGNGKVNLSRNGGFFLCYYNEGVLTQTRADTQPNGHVTLTTTPVPGGCRFLIPQYAEEFRFTLVGGGGGGANPKFTIEDREVPEKNLVITPNSSNEYVFSTDSTASWTNDALNKFWGGEDSYACIKGCKLTTNLAIGTPGTHFVQFNNSQFKYKKINDTSTISSLAFGENCSRDELTGTITVTPNTDASCSSAFYSVKSSSFTNQAIKLLRKQRVVKVGQAGGGKSGEIKTQTVSFLKETPGENVFLISPTSIGEGGKAGEDGGETTLSLATDAADIVAQGGKSGDINWQDVRTNLAGGISAGLYSGANGDFEQFIPVTLQLVRLAQGAGASEIKTPLAATYPGAGGGGGAFRLDALNSDNCLAERSGFEINGLYSDLECVPPAITADTDNIGVGGKGAGGAILIAW